MEILKNNFLGGDIYSLEVDDMVSFFDENYPSNMSDTGINSFLKSLKIPVKYFLKQPRETQLELLENQRISITNDKSIILLNRKGIYEYATLLDESFFSDLTENSPINSSWIPLDEDISNGYSRFFIPTSDINDGYNLGVFIEYPILFSKPMMVNTGFYKINSKNDGLPIEVFIPDTKIKLKITNLPNTEHDSYFIDLVEEVKNNKSLDIISSLESFNTDTDTCLELLLTFEKEKIINKSLCKKIRKYIVKEAMVLTNLENLVNIMAVFINDLKTHSAKIKFKGSILIGFMTTLKKTFDLTYLQNFQGGY